jgi:hypothetical protein
MVLQKDGMILTGTMGEYPLRRAGQPCGRIELPRCCHRSFLIKKKNGGFPAIAATCNLAPETGRSRSLRSGLAGTVEALGVQLPSSLEPFPLGAFEP